MKMIRELYRFISKKYQTISIDYPVDLKPRITENSKSFLKLKEEIEKNSDVYLDLIKIALDYKSVFHNIQIFSPDLKEIGWNNGFLPGLDIVMIYTIIAQKQPKKYIEVGSGNSTKIAHKAKMETCNKLEIISIDPFPRAEIDDLANQIIRKPFQDLDDFQIFEDLQQGDIVFIDNSHRILPNSDAMVFFMEVLPFLKKGVIVHVHDIYIPFDYPQVMCDRVYSEQYGLAFYLLSNPDKFKTIFPNYYISQTPFYAEKLTPIWDNINLINVERHGGSYWLEIQ